MNEALRALTPGFHTTLPIGPLLETIADTILRHPVTIVSGATGSGKSTQVPQLCLRCAPDARIGHTQPRRLAARTVAARIAHECGEKLGERIGCQTRFDHRVSASTRLKVMTDGILLQEITRDPALKAYDLLIIDEVHERSLNIDFLLGYLRNLLPRRPELRLVLMSATVEADRFKTFFGNACVIEIPGATYPVEIRYRPLAPAPDAHGALYEAIAAAIVELDAEAPGDVLVFLPGEREINEAAEIIRGARFAGTEVLPLYARLGFAEQQRVFTPHVARHIVLSTNVAETSITVPGVRHVIDSGLARIGSYSPRSKLQRLPISGISQASAAQRRGRCGRERAGICIRLYSEEQLARSPRYTQPELLRSNLAGVILRLADLRIGCLEDFPLLDPPSHTAINDGYQLLRELGALDAERRLLNLGRRLARLPVDPRLARMLLAAADLGCMAELLVIVSALSAGDIRDRPNDARQAADLAHQRFRDHRSDFLWFVSAWEAVQTEMLPLSRRQQQVYCATQFWSYRRVCEWIHIHRQLGTRTTAMSLAVNTTPASYRAVHQALLAGLATRVARWDSKADYVGCRQQRMRLHPGSALRMNPPKWIMAAEITETTLTYARMAAKIDPKWAAHAAAALVKRSYSPAQWDPTRGESYVLEEQALHGLTLISARRLPLHELDVTQARRVFIQQALIAGSLGISVDFLTHNLALVAKVRAAEERARRRDLLAEDTALFDFYAQHLPAITTRRQLLAWLRADLAHGLGLHMTEAIVTRTGIEGITEYLYPDQLRLSERMFPLSYRYAPGDIQDGVTVTMPLAVLPLVQPADLERLVPGLLAEKIAALIKRLPKDRRRYLSPLAEFAPALTAAIEPIAGGLCQALGVAITRITGLCIPPEEWNDRDLPCHLRMRVRLLDAAGNEIDATRNLGSWLLERRREIVESFDALPWGVVVEAARDWRFGVLPDHIIHVIGGVAITGYLALQDLEDEVRVTVLAERDAAAEAHRAGVIRLLMNTLPREVKVLRKKFAGISSLELQALRLALEGGIGEMLVRAGFESALGSKVLPRDAVQFSRLSEEVAGGLYAAFQAQVALLGTLFGIALQLLDDALPRVEARWPEVAEALRHELHALFVPGFLWRRASELVHYPRYLKAMQVRIERLQENPIMDLQRRTAFDSLYARCVRLQGVSRVQRERLRFLMAEYRVSLFAPTLRTAEKISPQRIEAFLSAVGETAGPNAL